MSRFKLFRHFTILSALICFVVNGWGQVSVTATSGTVGPTTYSSVNAAFTAINTGTHQGAITITITANTTEPTAVALLKSGTPSSYTSILIKPSGNVTLTGPAATNNGAVLYFLGADNVTINGDDPLTSGQNNLTITSPTGSKTQAVVRFSSNSTSGADGADNNTIKYCNIIGARLSATATDVTYGIVLANAATNSTGAYSSINTIIQNNVITRCWHGIFANGSSATYPNTGIQILNNTLGSATSADNIGFRGILISYSAVSSGGAIIRGNDIRVGDYGASGHTNTIAGIEVLTSNYGIIIDRNNIHDIIQPYTGGYGAHGIYISGSSNNTVSTITNNLIRDCKMVAYNTSVTSSFVPSGVYFSAGATGVSFVGNTIVMGTQLATGNFLSFCIHSSVSGVTFSKFQNNILVNNHSSSLAYCFYTAATTNISGGTVNNNCYYSPNGSANVGYYNASNRTTLSAWQTATSKDANAINVNPPFTSSTDLHMNTTGTSVASFFATGASGTGILTDFDGDTRATIPCIGADEFILPVSCTTPTSPTDGATNVSLTTSFTWAAATNASSYDVYLGTDNPPTNIVNGTNFSSTSFTPANALGGSTTYYWRIVPKNAGSTASGCSVWSFTTQAATPTLITSNLSAFSDRCINTTSSANSFNLSGIYLTTDDITVGPLTGFAFSSIVGGTYSPTLTISQPGGTLASTPIYVQFTPTSVASFNGNIPVSGGGLASAISVSAVGTGLNTASTASTGTSSAVTATTATVAGSFVANCQTISAYGIEYSTTSGFANGAGTSVTSSNQSAGSYTLDLSGLNPGTTYFYKAYATYGATTVLGTQNSFTTPALEYTSAATGDWNATTTWTGGVVPVCGSNVTILAGHNVTVNSSSNVSRNLTIASGGILTVASGDLTLGCNLNNTPLTNNGTLTVTGGTLNINGNLSCGSSSVFNQSAGNINIDGNNGGSATGSVASGTPLLNLLQLNSGINWTGGTLTIVDPHTATTNTNGYALAFSNATTGSNYPSANHIIQLGNGVSSDAGGHTSGFYINQWSSSAFLPFGSCVVNGPSGVNRNLNFYYTPMHIQGNVTVNNGGLLNGVTTLYIGGNILVNTGGSFINTGTVVTGTISSNTSSATTPAAVTIAQSIGGSGTFQNLATSSTASLTSLTINNTSSAGVTISTPLSISGTLTMTAGKINTTATNLLTLGTSAAAGTLAYTAGQITGPFARSFAASSNTAANYNANTLFPVGDGTNYSPIHIDPVTNASGPTVFRAQVFGSNSGSAGVGVSTALASKRWEALVLSGSSNMDSCFVGLNDAGIVTGNIISQATSASGTYNVISSSSTFTSGTPNSSLRSAKAITTPNFSGYFTYAAPGPAITSFTPTSACPNAARTITITGTNLGSATSVTLNGEACTITANTATGITITTDATPQAGNIVVTTSANSATSASALSLYTLPTVTATSDASNNTICSGSNITLNGGGASSYTWDNSVTNNIAITPTSSTTYTVTGTDGNGCTNTASIAVTVNQIVAVTSQPSNQVVLPNDNAVFSVNATGTGITYQWQENTGSGWNAITNGGIYSGATTSTLTLTGVTSSNSGYQYQCVVSGTAPCLNVTSSSATLTISSTAISVQPVNQTICVTAGTASFSITTTGTTPTYQWQVSTNGGSSWTDIPNENAATLALSGLLVANNNDLYRCSLNSGSIYSNSALLTVNAASVAGTVSADQGICSNASAANITLSGNTGTIQWQVSSDNSSFADIANATASPLTASQIGSLSVTRYYRAVVTNGVCNAANSSSVTVTVTTAPNAGTLSGTQAVCVGATTSFGSNGDAGGAWTSSNTSNASINSSGTVTGVAAGSATMTYTITGTGACSNATATRTVTINALPPITSATASPSAVCAGASVSLSAASVSVSTGTATLGSGNTTSNTYSNPFYSAWSNNHTQYVILASELVASGLNQGNITSLAIDITSAGSLPMIDFSLKIGTTSNSTASSFVTSGLTQVYTSASLMPTSGINTILFSTPFYWNGSSNLILEFCHGNGSSTATMSRTCKTNSTSYVSAISAYVMSSTAGSSICGNTSSNSATYSVRPQFIFGGQVGTNNAASYSWSWNTTPTVATATGTTTAVNSTSSAINQTYTVTATNATTGCTNTATTSAITINPVPATPSANSTSICGPQNATCSVTGSGTVGNTFKWYTVSTGGTAISGQTASTLSAYPISTTTTLYASESNANCESARVAVIQTVTTPPTITASASSATICAGASTTLSASSTNSGYTYSWNNSGGSGASVTVSPSATTIYTVTATDASNGTNNGCSTTATTTITVNPLPSSLSITPSTASICTGSTQSLVASGGTVNNQTIVSENFNSGVGTFNVTSTSSSTAQNWAAQSNGYVYSSTTFSGSTGGFMMANSDVGGSGATTNTILTSPSFSTVGFVSMSVNFKEYLNNATTTYASIEISNDNFVSNVYTLRNDITNDIGSSTTFNATSITIPSSYQNLASVKIRFRYVGSYDWYWAVDEFSVIGSAQSITWSPTTALYTDAAATVAYTGTAAATVYAKPTTTTTYTATATATTGCTSSNTTAITVSPTSVVGSVSAASSSLCSGTGTTLTLSGNTGTIQWQSSSDNVTFANMSGETASTLNTGNLTQTKYYKAVVTSGACTAANTSAQTITVSPTTVAGTISAASSSVCSGTGTTLTLSGNTGTIQWQNSTDNVTFANMSGETASSLSTGNLTQTSYYKAIVTSGVCTAANTSTQTITVNQPTLTWTGATSTDPTDPTNWNPTALPCTVSDITVPGGLTNYPIYPTTLTISSGGSYTLQAGAQLTVNGTLTNNGTFTLQDGATFVQGTSGTSIAGTGTYNVEKALTDNSSNWSTTSGRFWYMGVPMINVTRDSYGTPGTTTNRLWSYSEASKSYTELSNANDVLSAGTGYVHRRSTDGTLTFTATGANGLYGSNYTASGLTKTAGYTSGVNLVSNPYMAYLDWDAVYNASTNIDPTFYIRSNNVAGGDISALISYNGSTQNYTNTSSVTINNASQIRYIAPMQSVWVKVGASGSTGTVNMTRNMLSHQTGNGLKSSTVFPTLARVNLVDGNRFDQLLVYMNSDMSNEVDQYDSEKLPVSGTVQVYTMASNKKLVMNGLKNNKKKVSVPLYLELPASKSYTLNLADYVLDNGLILLEDKQEGTMQDFTLLGSYTFYANSGLLQNRFVLHFILPDAEFTTQGPSNSWVGPETSYTEGGNVQITNDDRGNIEITVDQPEEQKVEGNVSVTDMNGKEVYKGQLDGITTAVQLNVPAGIYYLTVQSGALFEKKKVFIQD